MVSSGPGNSGCKSSGIPYSEVNYSRYSPEMVDTASSSCIGPSNKFTCTSSLGTPRHPGSRFAEKKAVVRMDRYTGLPQEGTYVLDRKISKYDNVICTMAEGEIDNLTMEQYLALTRGNHAPGVVKPEIGGNVNFEIKSQFMLELREDTFSGNKNDDAHEHVERVLDIVSLFNILGVSHDAVMLRVFSITLTGAAKRWVDRLSLRTVDSWDLLKKSFIQSHQKVNIFYNGMGTMNRQLLDSQGPVPGMTPAQALTAIQNMADHSQKWYNGSSNRNIDSSNNSEGIAAIVSRLDSLGRDMKKLKENVHAIQVGGQTCGGAHLDKECPLNEEVKSVEEVKYGEFRCSSPFSNGAKYRVGPPG
ncbi:hypothetical protein Tco_0377767 [Tanacetum coccineum]